MKHVIILLLAGLLGSLVACQPTMSPNQPQVQAPTPIDTTPTIILSSTPTINDSIVLVLYPNRLEVRSTQLTTTYTTEPFNTSINLNEQWGLDRLTVNGTILLGRSSSNHTYTYGEDTNTLIVQKGNTLSSIIDDHNRMGYQLTLKELKKCNPFLSQRGLQVGDLLHLSCN